MKRIVVICLTALLAITGKSEPSQRLPGTPGLFMPTPDEYSHTYLTEGFASKNTEWLRCFQTGHFAMVMDLQTLEIPHFGALKTFPGTYRTAMSTNEELWNKLPAAALQIEIRTNGKTYKATGIKPWIRKAENATAHGPQLVEAGRYFQRVSLLGVLFTADDGTELHAISRLEVSVWDDRLSFALYITPNDSIRSPATVALSFSAEKGTLKSAAALEPSGEEQVVSIHLNPLTLEKQQNADSVRITAADIADSRDLPVTYNAEHGWYNVNTEAAAFTSKGDHRNVGLERIQLTLSNPTSEPQKVRLRFEKRSFKNRIGQAVAGLNVMLRDTKGNPTGLPVQISKNWHSKGGEPHSSRWMHALTQMTLAPNAEVELQLNVFHHNWGTLMAVSHAQLSLIGYGGYQHWSQSAIGAHGESICYDIENSLVQNRITDIRGILLNGTKKKPAWGANVGGGDFFGMYLDRKRLQNKATRIAYEQHGPCLTKVHVNHRVGDQIEVEFTPHLSRTDDYVRATYHLKMRAYHDQPFDTFFFAQFGADNYNYAQAQQVAYGGSNGLIKEIDVASAASRTPLTEPFEMKGEFPWISMHDTTIPGEKFKPPFSNRGIVIRNWDAKLGGRTVAPWLNLRAGKNGKGHILAELIPPPSVTTLKKGDYINATIDLVIVPQFRKDYYGDNEVLITLLEKYENTWKLIYREALGNAHQVKVKTGTLLGQFPDIAVKAINNNAEFFFASGMGHTPITIHGLTTPQGYQLLFDGKPLEQELFGNDYWQTDYDSVSKTWRVTYNVPVNDLKPHTILFRAQP